MFYLFSDLVPESDLTFDQYWALKFSYFSNVDILKNYLNYKDEQISSFKIQWMNLIEDVNYLKFDKPIVGCLDQLESLSDNANLFLCTARQSSDKTFEQLDNLGMLKYFENILVTQQKISKEHVISSSISNLSINDWMVGDTGEDIKAGKSLGIKTCAVLSGFMNKFNLLRYGPDQLIFNIRDFLYE